MGGERAQSVGHSVELQRCRCGRNCDKSSQRKGQQEGVGGTQWDPVLPKVRRFSRVCCEGGSVRHTLLPDPPERVKRVGHTRGSTGL